MESESHFEESIEERSESYEHTESSMSLYEGHSEAVSEEYTEHSVSFQEIPDYTTDFTNGFTGEFTNSWSEDEPESEEIYSENISESEHIEKRKHRTQKTNKQAKSVQREKERRYSTKSTEKDSGLQVQYKESYIDRKKIDFFT